MATFNKVLLMGRLTDNPEPPRTLPNSGTTVVKFRLAVGRSKKNPQTGFAQLTAFYADNCAGSRLLVQPVCRPIIGATPNS